MLKQLRADGIGHLIDGKTVASISGETFETKSPVDGSILATVALGNADVILVRRDLDGGVQKAIELAPGDPAAYYVMGFALRAVERALGRVGGLA